MLHCWNIPLVRHYCVENEISTVIRRARICAIIAKIFGEKKRNRKPTRKQRWTLNIRKKSCLSQTQTEWKQKWIRVCIGFFLIFFIEQNVLYPRDTSTKWKHTLFQTTYTIFKYKNRRKKAATIQFKTIEKRYTICGKKSVKVNLLSKGIKRNKYTASNKVTIFIGNRWEKQQLKIHSML